MKVDIQLFSSTRKEMCECAMGTKKFKKKKKRIYYLKNKKGKKQ